MQTLAAQLGLRLFERVGRGLRPSANAANLADALGGAFSATDDALDAVPEAIMWRIQGALR